MIFGSVCSGIEAASVAWHPMGWRASFVSEIDPFPRAVLAHHFPEVPIHGDFTTIEVGQYEPIDLLVGGTPCQSFSVAGLRGGLDDDRGNLALEFLRLAQRLRPKWLVWENVPGVLSSNAGRDFGAILGGMVELGYGIAYRVLDAQHFGVPQRRRRVFVVGYLGDWRRAAAVLFERHSLQGHHPPRRQAREGLTPVLAAGAHGSNGGGIGQAGDPAFTLDTSGAMAVAPTIPSRRPGGGGMGTDFDCDGGLITAHRMLAMGEYEQDEVASAMKARDYKDATDLIAHSFRAEGFDASEDGTGRGTPLVPVAFEWQRGATQNLDMHENFSPALIKSQTPAIAFSAKDHGADAGEISPTLRAGGFTNSHANGGVMPAVAFHENQRAELTMSNTAGTLKSSGGGKPGQGYPATLHNSVVRRLTPLECERLQGFPDDWTLVPYRGKPASDGPRYKALGNSMAVPCMAWIGQRIAMVNEL